MIFYLLIFLDAENDRESDDVGHHLEKIDDDCSVYDVHLVKMSDKIMAKKYGIKNPPGLILFRNGKPIKYNGMFCVLFLYKYMNYFS